MQNQADEKNMEWRVCEDQDLDATVDLLTKGFSEAEPLGARIGLSADDFRPFAADLTRHSVRDGLTMLGLMPPGAAGPRVGVAGVCTRLDNEFISPRAYSPKFEKILAFLDALADPGLLDFPAGMRVGHLWIGAITPEYQGRMLLRPLYREIMRRLLELDIRYFVTETTHPMPSRVVGGFGAKALCSLRGDDFVLDGERPFSGLKHPCVFYCGNTEQAFDHLSSSTPSRPA